MQQKYAIYGLSTRILILILLNTYVLIIYESQGNVPPNILVLGRNIKEGKQIEGK